VHHKFDKSNLISNALSRLLIKSIKVNNIDAFDIDDKIYVYNQIVIIINNAFRAII